EDLFHLINYKVLESRSDWKELALSPIFVEFPQKIRDWQYEIEDFREQLTAILAEKLKTKEKQLDVLINRLSPLKLASKLNEKKTRLALLQQKQMVAIKKIIDTKHEKLKILMASLD